MITEKWRTQNGIIYLSVTSDGVTGEEWIDRFERSRIKVSYYAKSVLCSKDFVPTAGITTEVAILCGGLWRKGMKFWQVEQLAKNLELKPTKAETMCLLAGALSRDDMKKMSLSAIVGTHEPIKDSGNDLAILMFNCSREAELMTGYHSPSNNWRITSGFAFACS